MEKEQDYIVLLDRFLKGGTSPEEEKDLLDWFRKTAPEETLYAYYRSYWDNAHGKSIPVDVQGRMFHQIKLQMKEMEQKRKNIRKLRLWWASTAAAVVALCVSIGISVHYFRQVNQMSQQTFVVSAEKGQRSNVVLPDGTKVWLNSDTEIKYSGEYGKKDRQISLSGEAYFEVAKDPKHRFIVQAGEMQVEALGTAFNVKAYEEDDELTASLFEGKVKTSVAGRTLLLDPDQSVSYNRIKHSFVKLNGNTNYDRMWRNQELVFRGESLEEVAIMLDRLYNVKVEFQTDDIKHYRFSGVIKNNSLENVFELISLTAPIRYEKRDSIIWLSRNSMN